MNECKGLDELGRCRLITLMDVGKVAKGMNWKCRKEGCAFYDQLTKKEGTGMKQAAKGGWLTRCPTCGCVAKCGFDTKGEWIAQCPRCGCEW